MTGDLSEPAQRAAEQAYEAAARLYEQAAAELTGQRQTAAWPPPISEVPGRRMPGRRWGISARQNCGCRNRLVPTASRHASRACVEDHLRPVTGGIYDSRLRRLGSPQSSQEVPAETQDEPAGTGRGTGTQRKDRCSGGPETSGWSPGTGRGPIWPLEVPLRARSPTACDPSASLPRPAPSRPERAWPFTHLACARWGGGAVRGRRGPGRAAGWPAGLR
jgi:hypothetical protein